VNDAGPEVSTQQPRAGRRFSWRRALGVIAALVVVVAVFANFLPRIADYTDVLDVVRELSTLQLLLLAVVGVINIVTFPPPWMAALPGLSFRQGLVLTQTSTALSSAVPGGDAVGIGVSFAMLRQWRFDSQAVTTAVVLTGLWNQLINVCLPLVALALLTLGGEDQPLLRSAGLIGVVVLLVVVVGIVAVMRGEGSTRRLGERAQQAAGWALRLARREPAAGWGAAFVHFRRETINVLARRWAWLTLASLAGHLSVFAVLIACLRVCDVTSAEVNWIGALAAWGLVRLLTAVPITPGGLGVVELGLTGALIGFGGHDAEVVAAVLLYRAITYLPPIVLGALFGLTWRRHRLADAAT
jgi:uncharacterized protein (TIRG00374 family)